MTNVEKVLQLLDNESVQSKFIKCKSREEAFDIVKSNLPDVSEDEIKQAIKQRLKDIQVKSEAYLNDEESTTMLKGADTTTTVTTVTTITAAASSYAFI